MSFQPHDGVMPNNVGDIDEVHPNCWDCFACNHSIDVAGDIGAKVCCPACGAEYEIVKAPYKPVLPVMEVKLTKRGRPDEGLRLHFTHNGIRMKL